jgi:hypothetical protein
MLRKAALLTLLLAPAGTTLVAQATGMPSFNAPYRAFERSEIGAIISFPNGGSTGFEGIYRFAGGKLDIGFRGGVLDSDGGDAVFLLGAEARQRVITHSENFPLDGALIFGLGALLTDNSVLLIPVGLSLGRRINIEDSQVSIIPYVQPTMFIGIGGGDADVAFSLGLGGDFRLTKRFDARVSAGIGDLEGISIGAVWVH